MRSRAVEAAVGFSVPHPVRQFLSYESCTRAVVAGERLEEATNVYVLGWAGLRPVPKKIKKI